MKADLREIGTRIEGVIKKEGISRAKLGELLEVGEGAIGRHIRGEVDPGTIALVKIAQLGNVTLDWLITGREPEQSKPEISREEALKEVAKAAYQGDKAFAQSICEAAGLYPSPSGLKEDEAQLVEHYRHASDEIREEAMGMLERSARRSRENAEGGSNCAGKKSA